MPRPRDYLAVAYSVISISALTSCSSHQINRETRQEDPTKYLTPNSHQEPQREIPLYFKLEPPQKTLIDPRVRLIEKISTSKLT